MSGYKSLRISSAVAAALISSVVVARAEDPARVTVTAPPVSVVVYNDQASVTRTGSVQIPAGSSLLVLSGVPVGVIADSVNARGKAVEKVAIGAVEVRQVSFDPTEGNRREAEIAAQIKKIDADIAVVGVEIAALEAKGELVKKFAASASVPVRRVPGQPGETAPGAALLDTPASWVSAAQVIGEESAATGERLRILNAEKSALEQRKTLLSAQSSTLSVSPYITTYGAPLPGRINGLSAVSRPAPPAGKMEFVVAVEAEKATTIEISVTYQIRNASWKPIYEARLDSDTGKIALRQEAVVVQRTGEDWDNVALSLSSTRPSAGVQPPTLAAWRINLQPVYDPSTDTMARRSVGSMATSAPSAAMMAAPAPAMALMMDKPVMQEASVTMASLNSEGLSVQYGIPGSTTVHSDGTERTVRVGDLSADSKLLIRAIPRLEARAYIYAAFVSPSAVPLLSGDTSLYLDGVFVGHAVMPLTRPGENARVPFGPDDRIKITYELQDSKTSSDWGLLAGTHHNTAVSGLTVVRSFHEKSVQVTLLDQLPVSSDEKLKVEEKADPAPAARNVDNRPGVVSWTYDMNKGEEKKITFGYSVNFPDGQTVSGLQH